MAETSVDTNPYSAQQTPAVRIESAGEPVMECVYMIGKWQTLAGYALLFLSTLLCVLIAVPILSNSSNSSATAIVFCAMLFTSALVLAYIPAGLLFRSAAVAKRFGNGEIKDLQSVLQTQLVFWLYLAIMCAVFLIVAILFIGVLVGNAILRSV